MASLANASSEFIDVFRQAVAAYDDEDEERAYSLFGEALEIEPDNVWALLWRGATAPTPSDTELWLEQALELEPANQHAQAGLEWAREAKTVEEAEALDVIEPEPAVEEEEPEEVDEDAFDWLDEEPAEEEPAADDAVVAEAEAFFEEEDEDIPDWLRDDDEEDTSVAVLDVEPEEALDEDEEDIPDWLRDDEEEAGETDAEAAVVDVDEGDFVDFDEDEEDVPDWLLEDEDEEEFFDEPEAPAATTEAEPTDEAGLPAWLTEEEEEEEAPAEVYETPEGSLEAPNETVAAFQAGLDAYDKNDLEAAQRHFERTIQLDDTHVEAHNYLGSVYFLQGRTDQAIDSFDRALQLDDAHAESYLNLGLVYQETGDRQKAVSMFENYLDLDPDSSIADDVRGFIDNLS